MSTTPLRDGATTAPIALSLGAFLRDRRARVQPEPQTPGQQRRRTPGLRREEVSTRAGVSVTWYTWLEQGRGGPPSKDVLERLARALELDRPGREMLFLLAQQRPPPVERMETAPVPRAVRRVLAALQVPALVKTPTWDIVAWNEAMKPITDFTKLRPRDRNLLRRLFLDPAAKVHLPQWEESARAAVAIFRMEVARMGGSAAATALEAELAAHSADFRRLWAEQDVQRHGIGRKTIAHPKAGALELEYSAFPIEDAEGLSLIVFTPSSEAAAKALKTAGHRPAGLRRP